MCIIHRKTSIAYIPWNWKGRKSRYVGIQMFCNLREQKEWTREEGGGGKKGRDGERNKPWFFIPFSASVFKEWAIFSDFRILNSSVHKQQLKEQEWIQKNLKDIFRFHIPWNPKGFKIHRDFYSHSFQLY